MTNDIRKMNEQELNQVAGGIDGFCGLDPDGPWTTVTGLTSGWLALRSDYKYDASNEIGQLYNGDRVQIIGNSADARTTILTAPASHGIHGSTPKGSIRAVG